MDRTPGSAARARRAASGSARRAPRSGDTVRWAAALRHLPADPVLESGEQRERDDERRDTHGESHDRDRGDERDVGAAAGRREIAQGDEVSKRMASPL